MSALLTPPSHLAGYSLPQSPNLASLETREQFSPSAIRAFLKLINKWQLTEVQARNLLGGIASSTFHEWKANPDRPKLSQDTLVRISLFLGIYESLHTYFGQPLADQWITRPNSHCLFSGLPPSQFMIRYGQPGIVQVRRLLDGWRSGF